MGTRIWLFTTSSLWLLLWVAAGIDSIPDRSGLIVPIAHVAILVFGLATEAIRMRIAALINVGYFAIYGLWVIARAYGGNDPADTATAVVLLGVPLLLQAFVNFCVYRWRFQRRDARE